MATRKIEASGEESPAPRQEAPAEKETPVPPTPDNPEGTDLSAGEKGASTAFEE